MSSFPPPSAFKAAHALHEAALRAQRPSEVMIGSKRYAAAAELGPVEFLPTDGGSARGQRLTARVMKSALATPPAQKTLLIHDGVEFKVSEIGGRNASNVAWVIRAVRWIE